MKKYSLLIEWSEEDGCYLGTCPEFRSIVNMGGPFVHGDTWEEVGKEAKIALQGIMESLEENSYTLPEPNLYKEK